MHRDIYEDMKHELGYEYISDLRFHRNAVRSKLGEISLAPYTEEEIRKFCEYVFEEDASVCLSVPLRKWRYKMKNMKKRMIALMLCMVMLLSGSTSALADDANAEMNTAETVQEVQAEPAALSEEPAQPETAGEPEATVEATVAAPTETAGGEADAPQATETAPEAAVTADKPQTAAAETAPHQDAMELTQEMKDADGNIVCTVKAEIPEGTFQANTSEVTMEVTDVDEPIEKEIKELMKKKLPDGKELGHYFLYNVSFKVNGQTTEPGREIKITFDKKDFRIEDVKKANVFYYNEANSPMGNTEAEIIEIIQKADKIEELQKAGESADNMDDYDLSEISLKADGTADKIQTEGRRSTVYGCYIEKDKPEETGDTAETEGLQYSVSMEGDDWKDVGTDEIRFIYRKTNGQYPTIETVDTAGMIDIGLYDYEKDEIISKLKFNGQDSSRYNQWIGYWKAGYNGKNDSYAVQGIVDKSLYGADGKALTAEQSIDGIRGYPKTAVSGGSVATELFDTNHTIATGLNHLFTKDSDGYYEYNSAEHYAYYKRTDNLQKNFVVYQETAKDEGFVPLLDIDEDSSDTRRYYYGMTVGFNFIQPENGQVNGNDMIFSFSGDDDVWVYVDGKLVLDIGGIHGAVGGSINFSNGTVSVGNVVEEQQSGLSGTLGKTTSLKEIFSLSGNTFEDYTEHRIEFIYLERGAGESNCHLKFNMPPIPKDSLQVTKEITNTDKEKYSNIDFSFKVYLQTEQNSEKYEMLPDGTEYQIWENNAYTGKTGKIENGIFKLKDGQTALFTGIARNLNYYAEEVDVSSDEFDKVEINGWNVSYVDENGNEVSSNDGVVDGDKNYIAQSDKKRVGGNSNIVFKNRCSTANKRELWVTKQMQTGQTADADETFSFKIKFQGKDGSWILYGKGEEYYKVDSQNTRSGPFEVSSDDGVITGIKPGESLVLTQIMSGTKFRVSEVGLDDTKYFTPSVTIENSGNYVCDDSEVENGIASGTIKLSKDAKVIVTNSKRVNTITIEKVDSSDVSKKLSGAKFKIEKQGGSSWVQIGDELTTDVQGRLVFGNLENGTYRITETQAPAGYIAPPESNSFTVTVPYTVPSQPDLTITVDASTGVTGDNQVTQYYGIAKQFTNQKKTWEILKRSSTRGASGESLYLEGAEFELTSGATDEETTTTYYGKSIKNISDKADGQVVWYSDNTFAEDKKVDESNIPAGTYTLKETKSPVGYACSTEQWTIILGQNGSFKEITGIADSNKDENDTKITCYFEDTPVYALPSAGGPGIHWYMIGGVLLMLAAALILYRNRCKEVQSR